MTELYRAIADVPNACQPLPNVVTGGQPGARQLEAARAAGCAVVVDLRDPMEPRPLDEPATVERLGMTYVNIPVSASTMNDDTLDRIRDLLREHGNAGVFLHCASGSRVGGAMIAHLILDHGFTEDDAVNEGMRMGLRSADLIEWSLGYSAPRRGT